MAARSLTDDQRNDIARRIAAGEKYPSIAAAVGCTIDNVKYHARKKKATIAAVKEQREVTAITAGLSEVDARVAQLEAVNAALLADLAQGYYGVDVKMSATGKTVEVPAFKQGQVTLLLRTLDDIAKERGGRKTNVDLAAQHTVFVREYREGDPQPRKDEPDGGGL